MKNKEIDKKIEELEKKLDYINAIEKRIDELKELRAILPIIQQPIFPFYNSQFYHFNNGMICYNNPCYWC